jgi:hypothetical protein
MKFAQKLELRPPITLLVVDAPSEYRLWLGALPPGFDIVGRIQPATQAAHIFATEPALLEKRLVSVRGTLVRSGFVWVSWPTTGAEPAASWWEHVAGLAPRLSLVCTKACRLNEEWFGVRLDQPPAAPDIASPWEGLIKADLARRRPICG